MAVFEYYIILLLFSAIKKKRRNTGFESVVKYGEKKFPQMDCVFKPCPAYMYRMYIFYKR